MRIGLALLVALCMSCAAPAPKSPAASTGSTAPEAASPAAVPPPTVIVTTDAQSVTGCRSITRTEKGYDIREPAEWRSLQEEAARLGGNTVLISGEADHTAEIFACPKP